MDTDAFSLKIVLDQNGLTLTLKDFTDWLIYSGEYTEENIGKEIHKKVDL